MNTDLDAADVDELCRLALAARRLDCRVHLVDAGEELRGLLDLAGVGEILVDCPSTGAHPESATPAGDLR